MRYGCFEISTACSSCGRTIPINGPFLQHYCTACCETMTLSPDRIAGFLNDFEEEYEGLLEGQGRGGTLISGSSTFKYGCWRLNPRCSSCGKSLQIPLISADEIIECGECSTKYYVFPAPGWLKEKVPSARLFCTRQAPAGTNDDRVLEIPPDSKKPIVISCPKCAGALTIMTKSERIFTCGYCR